MNNFEFKAIMLFGMLILSACAEVAPWERGILAQSTMSFEPNPSLRALRGHTYSSREGAAGVDAAAGGGCGCN